MVFFKANISEIKCWIIYNNTTDYVIPARLYKRDIVYKKINLFFNLFIQNATHLTEAAKMTTESLETRDKVTLGENCCHLLKQLIHGM